MRINPKLWARFIRELTGRIAQIIKEMLELNGSFWQYRPHTRIVRGWRKAFQSVKDYVELNQLEAAGHINRREINSLKQLRLIWADG